MLKLDLSLFYLINHTRSPLLEVLLPIFTSKLAFLTLMGTYLWGLWMIRAKRWVTLLLLTLFVGIGYVFSDLSCSKLLKPLFQRERPFTSLTQVYYYTPTGNFLFLTSPLAKKTLSFPSCHAMNASFLTTFTALIYKKTLYLSLPVTFLIGLSRIYLGHHYPFDVVTGLILGSLIALLFWGIKTKVEGLLPYERKKGMP